MKKRLLFIIIITLLFTTSFVSAQGLSQENVIGFTGQDYFESVDLVLFPYRAYSPDTGRFLQRDPSGYADGVNLYEYVAGNALGNVDSLGLQKSLINYAVRAARKLDDPRLADLSRKEIIRILDDAEIAVKSVGGVGEVETLKIGKAKKKQPKPITKISNQAMSGSGDFGEGVRISVGEAGKLTQDFPDSRTLAFFYKTRGQIEYINEGAFKNVYLMRLPNGEEVVVKVVKQKPGRRNSEHYIRELMDQQDLQDIEGMFDDIVIRGAKHLGESDADKVLFQEYLRGTRGDKYLKKPGGNPKMKQLLQILSKYGNEVEETTGFGDIKPENIIIIGDKEAVIVDAFLENRHF